jgi:hypothetical protein
MNQGRAGVELEREPAVGSGQEQAAAHPDQLAQEEGLLLTRTDVLDDRVREADVEGVVLGRQGSSGEPIEAQTPVDRFEERAVLGARRDEAMLVGIVEFEGVLFGCRQRGGATE